MKAAGDRIDRFEVVRLLGAGGMGAVYEARDPELDRSVAVKLIHEPDQQHSLRLLREAQALAQLQHPHVITVHEVGTSGDEIFVAMELVDGASLDRMEPPPSSWREVARLFAQAGAGLAAAHARGLVHRDVKPSNLLVDRAGRVRVADFGLARMADPTARGGEQPVDATAETIASSDETATIPGGGGEKGGAITPRGALLATPLTHAGAFLGTPRYMAPEQHAGEAATEKSDQFSFCVAMWEVLFGTHPFTRKEGETWSAAYRAGIRRKAPAGRAPRWLVALLDRGLAVDPAARHPSIAAIVDVLERRPTRARRVGLALGGVAVGGVVAAVAVAMAMPRSGAPAATCDAGAALIAPVWNAARRHALVAAFPDGAEADTATRIADALDARVAEWTAMHGDACRATHRQRTQSALVLDQRMACLDERKIELSSLTDALAKADAARLDRASRTLDGLPPIAVCGQARIGVRGALPGQPAERARHAELTAELARVRVEYGLGAWKEAGAGARAVADEAEQHGWHYLSSEARYQQARTAAVDGEFNDAVNAFQAATRAAADAGNDDVAALAWTEMISMMTEAGEAAKARTLLAAAETAVRRAGNQPGHRHNLLQSEAWIHVLEGDLAGAREILARALELDLREQPKAIESRMQTLGNLARVESELEQHAAAIGHRRDELKLCWQQYAGPHPTYAECVGELAQAINEARPAEGLPLMRAAIAFLERSRNPGTGRLPSMLQTLANAESDAYLREDAEKHMSRAIELFDAMGATHQAARARIAIARTRLDAGDMVGARAAAEAGMAGYAKAVGTEHPEYALAESTFGMVAPCAETRAHLEHAATLLTDTLGAAHSYTTEAVELRDTCRKQR